MLRMRIPVFVSVAVWILLSILGVIFFITNHDNLATVVLMFLLLPYPLVMSFFCGDMEGPFQDISTY